MPSIDGFAARYLALSLSFVCLNLGLIVVDAGRLPRSIGALGTLWMRANEPAMLEFGVLLAVTPAFVLLLDRTIDGLFESG